MLKRLHYPTRWHTVFVKRNPSLIHNFGGIAQDKEGQKLTESIILKLPYKESTTSTLNPPLPGGSHKPVSDWVVGFFWQRLYLRYMYMAYRWVRKHTIIVHPQKYMMSGHVKYKRYSLACKMQEDSACNTALLLQNGHFNIAWQVGFFNLQTLHSTNLQAST